MSSREAMNYLCLRADFRGKHKLLRKEVERVEYKIFFLDYGPRPKYLEIN